MSDSPTSSNGHGGAPEESAEPKPEPLRLGGMALRNGLLVHGPTHWSLAVRNSAGQIEVASGRKPSLARGRLASTPILRGPARLAEAMAVIPLARMRLRSARLPFEDPRVIVAAIGVTVATSAAKKLAKGSATRETLIAALGALPALTALRDRELAAYHGAEHKAIGGYESGEDPAAMPKEHERCGSNLIGPMLAFSVAGQVIVESVLERPNQLARGAASLAATGAAVEVFAFAERKPDSAVSKARARNRSRDPATGLDARADRRAARGRAGRSRRNPTGRGERCR